MTAVVLRLRQTLLQWRIVTVGHRCAVGFGRHPVLGVCRSYGWMDGRRTLAGLPPPGPPNKERMFFPVVAVVFEDLAGAIVRAEAADSSQFVTGNKDTACHRRLLSYVHSLA
jgi:hypothetical protein